MISRFSLLVATALAVALGLMTALPVIALADVDAAAQRLADRHSPIMMLQVQEEECDPSGEPYEPIAVEAVLDNPQILLRQVGQNNPVIMRGPGASDIADLGGGFYLDFPGDALAPECIFERDSRRFSAGRPAVVYAHVATQPDAPGTLALQYWFFWYYNDWNNKHEGDWEGIQLLFEATSPEEALRTDPVSVGYAQHEGGERVDWDSDELERRDGHPIVYPSAGSHASYFSPGLYLGRSASEGFGCDDAGGAVRTVEPRAVALPGSVTDSTSPLAWLAYDGRWGERQAGPFNGPTGPADKARWTAPVDWHEDLRTSSVYVPGGLDSGTPAVAAFCVVVEWGSAQLVLLKLHPEFAALGLLLIALSAVFASRRTQWSAVAPLPVARRRRAGQLIGAAVRTYTRRPFHFAAVGLVYLPIALLVGGATVVLGRLPLFGSLLESDRDLGPVGTFFALLLGGAGHICGLIVTVTLAALLMSAIERGDEPNLRAVLGRLASEFDDLLSAALRAVAIVAALLVSVIGIPWAIRQTVRYQFVPQVAALEAAGGRAALARSTELVRGRWLHTAIVIIVLNGLVGLVASALALLLLVTLTGIPLWLFSVIVTLGSGLIVPVTAIALVLLYGDAVAEEADLPPADPAGDRSGSRAATAEATA